MSEISVISFSWVVVVAQPQSIYLMYLKCQTQIPVLHKKGTQITVTTTNRSKPDTEIK